jgi:uncharacterized membrane protein YkvA (DUF1232 family)
VKIFIGVLISLLSIWIVLVVVLIILKPKTQTIKEALRILPDILRLIHSLSKDKKLPLSSRLRIWGLVGYLALPIDLIPDFIPVIGYADDAIIMAFVFRSIVKKSGKAALEIHWKGSDQGLQLIYKLTGL